MPALSEHPSAGTGAIVHQQGGQETSFTLGESGSELGYLTSIRNPANEETTFGYAGGGLLSSMTDPLLNTYLFNYDSNGLGRLTEDADPEGLDADPPAIYKTLARINESAREYAVSLTTALGRTTTYLTELLTTGALRRFRTNPDGTSEERLFGIDESREVKYADGTIVKLATGPEVGRFGLQATVSRIDLSTPAMRALVPPIAATAVESRSIALADPLNPGSVVASTSVMSANGREFKRVFDATNHLYTDYSPSNRQRFTKVDAASRTTEVEVDGFYPLRLSYDSTGRLETVRQGTPSQDERTFTFSYDAHGNIASVLNPLNELVGFEYDDAGRVSSQLLPDLTSLGLGYDKSGNLTSIDLDEIVEHVFQFNKINAPVSYMPPEPSPGILVPATTFTYNRDRQLQAIHAPRDHSGPPENDDIVELEYNEPNEQLSRIVMPDDDGEVSFGYDSTTRKVVRVDGPSVVESGRQVRVAFEYDGFLPTTSVWGCTGAGACPAGTIEGSVRRACDVNLRPSREWVNDSQEVQYQYDTDDLLTSAVLVGGETLLISRSTDKGGIVVGATLGEMSEGRALNGFGELESLEANHSTAGTLFAASYIRDGLGRIAAVTETTDGIAVDYEYAYDPRGRLVSVTRDGVLTATYSYDSNGNRLSAPNLAGVTAYDGQDRLIAYGDQPSSPVYEYDQRGRLKTKTVGGVVTEYKFDAAGNLRSVQKAAESIAYVIDGQFRRLGKMKDGALIQGWLYDGEIRIVAELDSEGDVVSRFVYGERQNVPEFMVRDGFTYRFVLDHLGSVRLVVDAATGAIVQRLDYDEWGIVLSDTNPGFQPFGFTGGLYDFDTGLVHLGARDYDPTVGRWIAKDPQSYLDGAFNLYLYANGDPINRPDTTGLAAEVSGTLGTWQAALEVVPAAAAKGGTGSGIALDIALGDSGTGEGGGTPTPNGGGGPGVGAGAGDGAGAEGGASGASQGSGGLSCDGYWRPSNHWVKGPFLTCRCFFMCIPCNGTALYGNNPDTLPSTWGVRVNAGQGGMKSGSGCSCRVPGPQVDCKAKC